MLAQKFKAIWDHWNQTSILNLDRLFDSSKIQSNQLWLVNNIICFFFYLENSFSSISPIFCNRRKFVNGLHKNIFWNIALTLLLVAATIVLSSNASAAENQGDRLGEFLRVGEYEGREFYKQRDTLGRTITWLYSKGDKWVVRQDLPEKNSFCFEHCPNFPLPPVHNLSNVFSF